MRPLCSVCNKNVAQKQYGREKPYADKCTTCIRGYSRSKKAAAVDRKPYRRYIKASCERCGFVPEHVCQLDVDHVDGDKANNDPTNLMTLCANCHRLKTYESGDYRNSWHLRGTSLADGVTTYRRPPAS